MNRIHKEIREFLLLNLKKGVYIKTREISGVIAHNNYINTSLFCVRENKSGNTINHIIDIDEIVDIVHPNSLSQEFKSLVVLVKLQQ